MKPYRKPLKCGAPRLLSDHNGTLGEWYREAYIALEGELGPFTPFQRLEAGRVAFRWVQWRLSAGPLEAAQLKRSSGKGRRPNIQAIERLKHREGLEDSYYSQAVDKLRGLAGGRRPLDLAQRLAQAAKEHER